MSEKPRITLHRHISKAEAILLLVCYSPLLLAAAVLAILGAVVGRR